MKRIFLLSMILLATAAPALAQDPLVPSGGEHDGGGPGGVRHGGGPGGPDGGGPMGHGEPHTRPSIAQYEMLGSYIETVNQFAKLAGDPTALGVAAVIAASDLLRQHDVKDSIQYLTKVLPDVKNVVVQRAIRMQLGDLYMHDHAPDKALEQLDLLIRGAPATTQPAP